MKVIDLQFIHFWIFQVLPFTSFPSYSIFLHLIFPQDSFKTLDVILVDPTFPASIEALQCMNTLDLSNWNITNLPSSLGLISLSCSFLNRKQKRFTQSLSFILASKVTNY